MLVCRDQQVYSRPSYFIYLQCLTRQNSVVLLVSVHPSPSRLRGKLQRSKGGESDSAVLVFQHVKG